MKTPRRGGALRPIRGLRLALLGALRVHRFAQVFACLEADVLRCRNRDLFVRAGIAAFARFPLRYGEAAEPRNSAALTALTRARNVAYERVERSRGFLLRNARLFGDFIDDVTLACHRPSPLTDAQNRDVS